MSELWQLGALELAQRIAAGDITSRSAVGAPSPIDPVVG